jgi:hypothetical protein
MSVIVAGKTCKKKRKYTSLFCNQTYTNTIGKKDPQANQVNSFAHKLILR